MTFTSQRSASTDVGTFLLDHLLSLDRPRVRYWFAIGPKGCLLCAMVGHEWSLLGRKESNLSGSRDLAEGPVAVAIGSEIPTFVSVILTSSAWAPRNTPSDSRTNSPSII